MTDVPKEANACPIMKGYWCFDRACGINHKTQCMMINPKDKIYVDGGKAGDYIQQNIVFRREMEMNYAKTLDQNADLTDQLKQRDETIKQKEVAFSLIVKQQVDEIRQLKEEIKHLRKRVG